MQYLVALLADRFQAEAAYLALEAAGLPLEAVALVGRGYREVGDYPLPQGGWRPNFFTYWLVPFGFGSGVGFSVLTGLDTFTPWAGVGGNHLLGGLLGAIAGGMGSVLVGGGLGQLAQWGLPNYARAVTQGKYVVVVQGTGLVNRARGIVLRFQPQALHVLETR
ncbi:hypothetical protein GlitD10_2735 [Gloeomargarita lithophora Alchichica-D10]|uniref:Uncharacterized protein n=1 Tax=Gloeomargarita lithophora Alchichica-D10 TaxID=1188229 RepID=A0A1J0AGL7_9CYAN|nr:hypothetical protein [Gloeomargarita lithophora]APB35078.1 hypothetical protein GlitD10_2735 [Gloeomargarita lithophora Alchichica-D10]